jgi:uncharacterized protein (DUF433 family)
MIPSELSEVLSSEPAVMSGAVCFAGTRVPVEILFDYLAEGVPLDRFLQGYPTVSREQALAVLRWQSEIARKQVGLAP